MPGLLSEARIRLLPYPDGKTFAFTIVDDTDGATLETVRPIYDYLFSLGLRTTKTVWVMKPGAPPDNAAGAGDTLERQEYADYIRLLQRRAFEIALHNVSGKSNTRPEIAAGIERFKQLMGEYPRIDAQHEKNLENIYFQFAQSGRHLPPPFRTAIFRRVHAFLRPNCMKSGPRDHGCSGENCGSEYFWGDLCKAKIKYVRSNVFFRELNTLKCNPAMPYVSAETPYVNYWFDSSNGQDADCFNSLLSNRNIDRLRSECGCSIVYTHFGKGFVRTDGVAAELNGETRQRLRAIAGHADGWYVPAGDLLDRLLAFQHVTVTTFAGGFGLINENSFPVAGVTLQTEPAGVYCGLNGGRFSADRSGRIVIPSLPARQVTILMTPEVSSRARRWYEQNGPAWLADVRKAARKLQERFGRACFNA